MNNEMITGIHIATSNSRLQLRISTTKGGRMQNFNNKEAIAFTHELELFAKMLRLDIEERQKPK